MINQTEDHRYRVLLDCAANIRVWNIKVHICTEFEMPAEMYSSRMVNGGIYLLKWRWQLGLHFVGLEPIGDHNIELGIDRVQACTR